MLRHSMIWTMMTFFSLPLLGAAENGTARLTVLAALNVTTLADLDFGAAPQGDPGKTISPQSIGAASFQITGEPNSSFSIILPTFATMNQGRSQIWVNNFVSTPANSGALGTAGSQNLKVGATRAPIATGLPRGLYSGSFIVTVVY